MIYNKTVSMALLIILVSVIGGLSGCAGSIATKTMVPDSISILQKHPYTVSIRTQGGTETNVTDFSNISNDAFTKAIEESIIKSGIFTKVMPPQGSNYSLNVTIINFSQPFLWTGFTAEMEAAWSLVNTLSKDIVMRKSIKSSYTAAKGNPLIGNARIRHAVEGSARENIRLGLIAISKLQLK